jgi:N-methylhydantoinase A
MSSSGGGWALAVDIGGTFTDAVLRHRDGSAVIDKTLTTHRDLLEGFFRAVDLVLARAGIAPAQVDDVTVHATTLVTNAVIERRGPPAALVTTEGFADVLIIRDEHRYDMFDPQIEFPAPLVPEALTFTLRERTLADGTVLRATDLEEAAAVARAMASRGCAASLSACSTATATRRTSAPRARRCGARRPICTSRSPRRSRRRSVSIRARARR